MFLTVKNLTKACQIIQLSDRNKYLTSFGKSDRNPSFKLAYEFFLLSGLF